MKVLKSIPLLLLLISCGDSKIDFDAYKKSQDYKVPVFNMNSENKISLFIFPHPDDEIVCGGTIHQLKTLGWETNLLTLTKGLEAEKTVREKEWANAAKAMQMDHAELYDLPNNTWDNVLKDQIIFWKSNKDSVENMIYRAILKYKPGIVFTYDTCFGGYGHPEHRLTALITYQIFKKHSNDSTFPVKSIFQITLPEKHEQLLLSGVEPYENAKKITGNKSLPEPTIAFDIEKDWPCKKMASGCYVSQLNTLSKFHLYPDEQDTLTHYNTFDREYYFEIKR